MRRTVIVPFVSLILLIGLISLKFSLTGFVIADSDNIAGYGFWVLMGLLLGITIMETAALVEERTRHGRAAERLESIIRDYHYPDHHDAGKDITGSRTKLYKVNSGNAEIYASRLPKSYHGMPISEKAIGNGLPVIKIFFESRNKDEKVESRDFYRVFEDIFEAMHKYGQVIVAPTVNESLAKIVRKFAKENHHNLIVEERSGSEMSDGLFEYLRDDLSTKKKMGLRIPNGKVPKSKKEFTYFVFRPVDY